MDVALLGVSVALLFVTAAYTVATVFMVKEMRESRLLSVRPKLALDIRMTDPMMGFLSLKNLGPGAAVNVDVVLGVETLDDRRPWRAPTFLPGETHDFNAPRPTPTAGPFSLDELAARRAVVRVTGSMKDIYGHEHVVSDEIELGAWWTTVKEAKERFARDPGKSAADSLRGISRKADSVAQDVHAVVTLLKKRLTNEGAPE